MTDGSLHGPPAAAPPPMPLLVDRPPLRRAVVGGRSGLLVGVVFALLQAFYANWATGMTFDKYDPVGQPIWRVLAWAVALPTAVGALGGLLLPLYRRGIWGARLAIVSTLLPVVVPVLLLAADLPRYEWLRAGVVAGGLVGVAIAWAGWLRAELLGVLDVRGETSATQGRHDT